MPDLMARGFATLQPDRHKAASAKGGRAAHQAGKAHEFTSDEAKAAGRLGGQRTSANREHMAAIGRKGAKARIEKRKAASPC